VVVIYPLRSPLPIDHLRVLLHHCSWEGSARADKQGGILRGRKPGLELPSRLGVIKQHDP
jgi:hypothetical protein